MVPPPSATANGISLANLQLNDHGLRALRSFLSASNPALDQYPDRLDSAALAWFVAGVHKDNDHQLHPNTFHPAWKTAFVVDCSDPDEAKRRRNEIRRRLKELLFDTAVMLDRSQGGCTLILHVDGPIAPGLRPELHNVKIDVVLPPHFLYEIPNIERPLAEVVQKFAESLGLNAVYRWRSAFLNTGRSLTTPFVDERRSRPIVRPFMPQSSSGTNRYLCYGRPVGQIEDMLEAVGISPRAPHSSVSQPTPEIIEAANTVIHDNEGDDSDDSAPERGQREWALEQCIAGLQATVEEKEKFIEERDNALQEMGRTLAELDQVIEEKDRALAEKERELVERDLALADKVRLLAERSRALQMREEDLRQLRARLLGPSFDTSSGSLVMPTQLGNDNLPDNVFGVPTTPTPSRVTTPARAHLGSPIPFLPHGHPAAITSHIAVHSPAAMPARSRPLVTNDDEDDGTSSHSSTIFSLSDWSGSTSPAPAVVASTAEWEMPSHPLMPPSFSRAAQSLATPASPITPSRLTRFSTVGTRTAATVRELGLLPSLHRHLSALVDNVPDDDWVHILVHTHGLTESAAQRIKEAMCEDVPAV
ncbi:hypothetical protein C2E23DRAFT_884613 [Lenzites betulinus]|nr:hypothetical protein C2E23DRAFT_884613 [Lenzites betulinus]